MNQLLQFTVHDLPIATANIIAIDVTSVHVCFYGCLATAD